MLAEPAFYNASILILGQPLTRLAFLLFAPLPLTVRPHNLGDLVEVGHVEQDRQFAVITVLVDSAATLGYPSTRNCYESPPYQPIHFDSSESKRPVIHDTRR